MRPGMPYSVGVYRRVWRREREREERRRARERESETKRGGTKGGMDQHARAPSVNMADKVLLVTSLLRAATLLHAGGKASSERDGVRGPVSRRRKRVGGGAS